MSVLSNYLFYIAPIGAAIAFLASLTIFFIPGGELYLKHFSFFLFVNACLDIATGYMALYRINNVFITNVNTTVVICYYLFLLRQIIQSRKAKKGLLIFLAAYFLLSVMNFFLVQKTGVFNSITYCLGCLGIVAASIYFFWELFQQTYSGPLGRQPAFWICSGLLFYYTCTFPVYGSINLLKVLPQVILENLLTILVSLNILLYLSFTIAFLCRLKTRKSMS
jgi:hypothetical protein